MKTYTPLLLAAVAAALWYFWPDLQAGRNKTAVADAKAKADALDAANKKLQADLDKQTEAAAKAAADAKK
jgi:phosphoenolpyruvate-protein kinase (PTS system EI component)